MAFLPIFVFALTVCTKSAPVPEQMRSIRKSGVLGCGPPDLKCVQIKNMSVPTPLPYEALIRVSGSSVNPDELSILQIPLLAYTPGIDVSGTVAAVGSHCTSLKVGDRVWTMFATGGMAEYTTHFCHLTGKVPEGLDLANVGTLPTVAMTSLGALETAGAPWKPGANISVLITAGTGGTGYMAVQLAKALGATRVITAASGEGVAFAKSLGADVVVDYHNMSVFDAVADGSVDVVLNNHDSPNNAKRAMQKLRAPGVYVSVVGDYVSDPPAGVRQIDYSLATAKEIDGFVKKLDTIAGFITSGKVRVEVQGTFDFDHVKDAYIMEATGHVMSKVSVVPALHDSEVVV